MVVRGFWLGFAVLANFYSEYFCAHKPRAPPLTSEALQKACVVNSRRTQRTQLTVRQTTNRGPIGKMPIMKSPSIEIRLSYRRVGFRPAELHTKPDPNSPVVGRLIPGSIMVSLAEVATERHGTWLRVFHAIAGEGYVSDANLWCVPLSEYESHGSFEIARRPRRIWPEPNRRGGADVTFTCTFNGRMEAFFEAMGSVLAHLDELDSIDSWIIVCDRGATAQQRSEIMLAFPWATVVCKGPALHGHPKAMNILLSLLRTRWWLQWEDDWRLTSNDTLGPGVLARAREVCSRGIHQVALNGAWLEFDQVWSGLDASGVTSDGGIARATCLEEHPLGYENVTTFGMMDGAVNRWAEVKFPDEQRRRIADGEESFRSLVDGYLLGVGSYDPSARGTRSSDGSARRLLWPLYSNQPSLNDSSFMRSLSFNEEITLPGCYWAFEFDFGLQFVRAGGRKASLRSLTGGQGSREGLAVQINVESSSRMDVLKDGEKKGSRDYPHRIPIALDLSIIGDKEGAGAGQSELASIDALSANSVDSKRKFAGGCTIGKPLHLTPHRPLPALSPEPPSTQSDARPLNDPNMANSEAAGAPNDEAAAILRTALATKLEEGSVSSVLLELQNLKRERGRSAARERLIELGFGKVGERLRLEHALMG